ncbi:olfactory receptor 146 [Xyrauchen texanus]|uniref:olfactory receptor 146 n=1 Tax=Xyrauchen texanus TaxID=154827 RepID=UPI002242256D|nr:olfactory receptor 146 [Xyrauchen texanus]
MENLTYNSMILQLEGLKVSEQSMYPVFLFFLIFYVIILVTNIGIFVLIAVHRSLHEPMYILFCNLPFNDVLGNSIMIPRLLVDILRPSSERSISYVECAIQAFCSHTYGTTSHTILMIMAFDRYVAICDPLRYTTIMTNKMVIALSASAWGVAIFFISILLGLTYRLNRCRTFISNPFCDNVTLFKLSCEDVSVNNLYGLIFTVLLFVSSMGSIALTYIKITAVCLSTKSKTLNSRALKTCSTHLAVYLIMLMSGFIIILLHRFPAYADYRKISALLFHIVPSILNPLIYGLQCTEIRHVLIQVLCSKKVRP